MADDSSQQWWLHGSFGVAVAMFWNCLDIAAIDKIERSGQMPRHQPSDLRDGLVRWCWISEPVAELARRDASHLAEACGEG